MLESSLSQRAAREDVYEDSHLNCLWMEQFLFLHFRRVTTWIFFACIFKSLRFKKNFATMCAFQIFYHFSSVVNIQNMHLLILFSWKVGTAGLRKGASYCKQLVMRIYVCQKRCTINQLAAIYTLQFFTCIVFVALWNMFLQITLIFEIKATMVVILALNKFSLMFCFQMSM